MWHIRINAIHVVAKCKRPNCGAADYIGDAEPEDPIPIWRKAQFRTSCESLSYTITGT